MKRITDINELKPGDKIWSINTFTGNSEIIEFVCIHPHNDGYSVFLDINYDGMPKFYNKRLTEDEWYFFDNSNTCWNEIHNAKIAWHERKISHIKERLKKID